MKPAQPQFDFIVNRRSGAVLKQGAARVEADLREIFAAAAGNVLFVEGQDLGPAVRRWLAQAPSGTGQRSLIVGGGDGSVLAAAEAMLGRADVALGVLPLGTHNLLARQLGFSADFRKAAAQYGAAAVQAVDVGRVNGMHFLVGLLLDPNSVHFYEARESLRDRKPLAAWPRLAAAGLGLALGEKLGVAASQPPAAAERRHRGRLAFVTNNPLRPRSSVGRLRGIKDLVENFAAREGLDGGTLALYVFRGNIGNVVDVARDLWRGTWTQHRSVSTQQAPALHLRPIDGAKDGDAVSIVLDGEIRKTRWPLDIKILPRALRVYRPQ